MVVLFCLHKQWCKPVCQVLGNSGLPMIILINNKQYFCSPKIIISWFLLGCASCGPTLNYFYFLKLTWKKTLEGEPWRNENVTSLWLKG